MVKPPGQDMVVERLKSRYGLAGRCFVEVRWVEAAVASAGRLGRVPALPSSGRLTGERPQKPPRSTGRGFGPGDQC